ncbi:MAG: SH3 domain-containing protein [Chloroflexi bacterium]|nr:SH3 domain-containing protein [Chloroflexota bacterium]
MRAFTLLISLLVVAVLSVAASPVQAQAVPNATVTTADHLNVRVTPSTQSGVIAVVDRGMTFQVLGRSSDGLWWQILLPPSGQAGWVSGQYVQVVNAASVPVLGTGGPGPATVSTAVITTGSLNARAIPDPYTGQILTTVSLGTVHVVVGKTSGEPLWVQINLQGGGTGWINADYANVTNLNLVPVTYNNSGQQQPGGYVSGYVVNVYFLNVRTAPNPFVNNVITMIPRNQTFQVVGKTSGEPLWVEIILPSGVRGWINADYAVVSNIGAVPVTYNNSGQQQTGVTGTVVNCYFLNVRSTPNPFVQNILAVIARNQSFPVVGKNSAGTWYQINVNGVIGWVSGNFLQVTNPGALPVTF